MSQCTPPSRTSRQGKWHLPARTRSLCLFLRAMGIAPINTRASHFQNGASPSGYDLNALKHLRRMRKRRRNRGSSLKILTKVFTSESEERRERVERTYGGTFQRARGPLEPARSQQTLGSQPSAAETAKAEAAHCRVSSGWHPRRPSFRTTAAPFPAAVWVNGTSPSDLRSLANNPVRRHVFSRPTSRPVLA